MSDSKYTEIRCASERPHLFYALCGGIIGAVNTSIPSDTVHRCPICGLFWAVKVTKQQEIIMKPMKKGKKIPFKRQWRIVLNGY